MYKGAAFKFTFVIEQDYPHKPPKVKCVPKVRPRDRHLLQLACESWLTVPTRRLRSTTLMSTSKEMSA
jgi:hypothetical protein